MLLMLTLLAVCSAAFILYQSWRGRALDTQPPVITVPSEPLELSVQDDPAQLLQGIRAYDAKDGDVTTSVVVESVYGAVAQRQFQVTYAAFDRAGNVAKAKRAVLYTDYESPRFSLSAPLIFRPSGTSDIFGALDAADVFDGSLKDRIKGTILSGEGQIYELGEHVVQFRVTNSLGDTAYLTAPVLVTDQADNAAITLTQYLVYLEPEDAFDAAEYLDSWQAGAQRTRLHGTDGSIKVQIDDPVDTSVPGTYCVEYTAESGQYHARTRLIVVVEE